MARTSHYLAAIVSSQLTPSSSPYFFPSCDMAHQSQSARFQDLIEPALQAYEKKAGVSLAQHPLAIKIQSCDSVEAITGLLQDQAQAFRDLQGSDKIMKSIKVTVSILSKISSAASLVDAFGLVHQKTLVTRLVSLTFDLQTFPPAKAIQVCIAILLDVRAVLRFVCTWLGDIRGIQSAKGIISNCDALVDLLESIEHFLNRLNIYTRIAPTPVVDEIVGKILVEVISTFALVTEELKQRRSSEPVLTNILLCSTPRSQICKEVFQGEGYRGSPG